LTLIVAVLRLIEEVRMLSKKTIAVGRISLKEYNKMIDEGFEPKITNTTRKPSVFANYKYERTVSPNNKKLIKEDEEQKDEKPKTGGGK
jgi:preprotein translocase subunit SecA